ncbi:phosphate acyltransferase, partial [Bacillus subtilis]
MSKLLNVLSDKLSGKNVRIVLPEGDDARVLTAAVKLQTTDLVSPIVLGNEDKIKETADGANLSIEGLTIINPETSELKADLVE